jgi:hypothetical protein
MCVLGEAAMNKHPSPIIRRELSNKTIKNFEATMEKDSASMTKAHEQMSKAVAIAARKVEKKKRRKQVQKSTGGSLQKRKRKDKECETGS